MTTLAAVHHVSQTDALFWIGVIVVVGLLVSAGVYAYRFGTWVVPAVLAVLAILAAVLLL